MPTAATASWAIDLARSAAGRLRRTAPACTFYEVLGLPPGADGGQIKTAYRELARRLHPDVNAGDAASAERLVEVNHAYEVLSDQRARSAYDHALACQRTKMRRHYGLLAACSTATFAVTLIAVSVLVRWHLEAEPLHAAAAGTPSDWGSKVVLQATVPVLSGAVADPDPAPKSADQAGWTTFRDPRFAFTLEYPAGIFTFDVAQSDAHTHTFVSRDRRATFRIVAAENATGVSLARFRRTLMKKRYAGASFERTQRRRHWFVLAGTLRGEAFLERVTFSCDGKTLHGWQMRYPVSQRATYDELAKQVLRNHPHGNGPAAGCKDTKPRRKRPRRRRAG
jgi:curved DNA-binding protein CbpA